jgi:putative heme-binding domain-containing protein
LDAIGLLGLGPYERQGALWELLLSPEQPPEIRKAALEACANFNSPDVADLVLGRWSAFSPAERLQAAELLLRREAWVIRWLERLKQREVEFSALEPSQLARLNSFPSAAVQALVSELRGEPVSQERRQVFSEYRDAALAGGDAAPGKAVFEQHCSTCHALAAGSDALGPNLLQMARRGRESLLFNILVPNGEVDPRYLEYIVLTADGEVVTGAIAGETSTAVTIRTAENKTRTILRVDIDELRNTGKSLMPEGFERNIDQRAMADLLAYLEQAAATGETEP